VVSVEDPNGRTALYRLSNADGELLYIGISRHPEARWKQHEKDKLWWPQVAEKDVTWFDARLDAGQAEQEAILVERPRYNGQRDKRRVALISQRSPRLLAASEPPSPTTPAAAEGALNAAVEGARARYDAARAQLFAAIKAALAGGVGPSEVSRRSGFTREYVTKIRDGKGPKGV
jgi:predicted GIY-YIG superfamily endonuclease